MGQDLCLYDDIFTLANNPGHRDSLFCDYCKQKYGEDPFTGEIIVIQPHHYSGLTYYLHYHPQREKCTDSCDSQQRKDNSIYN